MQDKLQKMPYTQHLFAISFSDLRTLFCRKNYLRTFLSQKEFMHLLFGTKTIYAHFLSGKRLTHFIRKVFARWKLPSGKFRLFGPLKKTDGYSFKNKIAMIIDGYYFKNKKKQNSDETKCLQVLGNTMGPRQLEKVKLFSSILYHFVLVFVYVCICMYVYM